MNTASCHATFVPYGAHALKATYQRNLSLAMLAAVTLVALVCLAGWLAINLSGAIVKPGPIGTINYGSRINAAKPPVVIPDQPPINSEGVAAPTDAHGTIPVPVPDNEIVDNDAVVMNQGEISGAIDFGNGGGGSIGGDAVGFAIDPGDDLIPERGAFQYCEAYPELVHQVQPDYPRQAIMLGQEGRVIIEALIDKEGGVREAVVAVSSGFACLDDAALRAAFLNKYRPGIQNGQPVMVWIKYDVNFKIE